jgi:hypothetical protein
MVNHAGPSGLVKSRANTWVGHSRRGAAAEEAKAAEATGEAAAAAQTDQVVSQKLDTERVQEEQAAEARVRETWSGKWKELEGVLAQHDASLDKSTANAGADAGADVGADAVPEEGDPPVGAEAEKVRLGELTEREAASTGGTRTRGWSWWRRRRPEEEVAAEVTAAALGDALIAREADPTAAGKEPTPQLTAKTEAIEAL